MSTQEICISIDQKLSRLSNTSNEHCIFKVHHQLRSHNERAYEPQVLAIGPYHHGKRNLEKMETYKLRYLQDFLNRSKEKSTEKFITALTKLKDDARKCYAEEIKFKDDARKCHGEEISLSENDFVEMMFLDGLFIVEFLRKFRQCTDDDSVLQKNWLVNSIFRDLILIENQIPFFILNKLFEMTKKPSQEDDNNIIPSHEDDIIQFGLCLCDLMNGWGSAKDCATKLSGYKVSHLLDLVHKSWCLSLDATIKTDDFWSLEYIKSATELQKTGVKFRSASNTKSWLDITFDNGIIKIPTLIVDDCTESILRNLIAYEQYTSNFDSMSCVTDYVMFLDLLIDRPRDVEQLRHHGIIENQLGEWLGDDEVVSKMFNGLLRDITVNDWRFCYGSVFQEVNKYSSNRWNRGKARCVIWMGELMKKYFSSPWSIISFLAAGALLILTVVQTIFSILAVSNGN